MYLHKTPFWLKILYPSFIWHQNRKEKTLYLTFDDGPVPGVTEFVLDQLNIFEAKATFFCVGDNIEKHSTIFKEILNNGHSIGNHTYNHLNGWKEPDDHYLENIMLCQNAIDKYADGQYRRLLRPPYGKIKRQQAQALKNDYNIIMWDVLSGDFDANLRPEDCLTRSVRSTRNGSIIIFHDSIKAEKNLRHALPGFLKYFVEKGYSFKAL